MKRLLLPCALVVVSFGACVGDSTITSDSGAPDATGDNTVTPDSGSDTGGPDGDGSDGSRPVPPATGDFNWEAVGSGNAIESIAYDSAGNLFFAFVFSASTVFAVTTYTAPSASEDILLVKFDPTGHVLWVRQYGGTGDDELNSLAVDPSGDVYATVYSQSATFSFGNGVTYTKQGVGGDGFVVKLKGANGDGVWVGNYTKSNDTELECAQLGYGGGRLGIACASAQGLALTKVSDSSALPISCLECGGTPIDDNIYLASLDPATGRAYWGTVIASDSATAAQGLGVDGTGAVVVDFTAAGTVVHDPTNSVNSNNLGVKGASAFVVKLAAANGAGVWLKEFTDGTSNNNNQTAPGGIAFDSTNNVVFGGQISGTVPFGIVSLMSGGSVDVFVAKLKAQFGDVIWARTFGGALEDDYASVGVDPWDEVFVTGRYLSANAKVDAFPFPAVPSGKSGIYIGKLDPNAQGLWATGIVSSSTLIQSRAFPNALAVDWSTGGVAVTGYFQGTVDLGNGTPVTSPNGQEDNFVVVRKP